MLESYSVCPPFIYLFRVSFQISENVSPIMIKLAHGLAWLAPTLYMPWNSIDREKLTPNLEQRERDAADPMLWHYGVRAGFGAAIIRAVNETTSNFNNYCTPTFIFHGEFDDVCDYSGSKKLAEIKPDLVKIVRYEYPYHSLFHLMPEVTNSTWLRFLYLTQILLNRSIIS